jgi:hypothetical protein
MVRYYSRHGVVPNLRRSQFIGFERVSVNGQPNVRVRMTETLATGREGATVIDFLIKLLNSSFVSVRAQPLTIVTGSWRRGWASGAFSARAYAVPSLNSEALQPRLI